LEAIKNRLPSETKATHAHRNLLPFPQRISTESWSANPRLEGIVQAQVTGTKRENPSSCREGFITISIHEFTSFSAVRWIRA